MKFEEREVLINFLKTAEKKYSVKDWTVEDVEVWPIIKTSIFFSTYNRGATKSKNLKSKAISFFKFLKLDVAYSYYWLKRTKIREVNYLFSGFFGHRVIWEGTFYNRYFDPIMDHIENVDGKHSTIFEYDKKRKVKHYREDRIIDATKFIHYFNFISKKVNVEFEKFQGFDDLVMELEETLKIDANKLKIKISDELNNAFRWKKLWLYILNKNKASQVFVLCYYNSKMYGLLLAAKDKGLISVDMQHGGQSDFHIAYNFTEIPARGYKLLPDFFWNWDSNSADNNLKYTKESLHKVVIGGNPWLDFLKNQEIVLEKKIVILYTLQTTLVPVLHDYIIEAIKNTPEEYTWWLRLHPRMTEAEINSIYQTLKIEKLIDKVEIDKATSLPLPIILANCSAHISHFSGSILEADLMNVKTNIIIGEIGKKYFNDVLENKRAIYFEADSKINLFDFIEESIINSKDKKVSTGGKTSYKDVLKWLN